MAKTLYIHIGHYKTGTTALQVFAHRFPAILARARLAYSENLQNHAKQSILAFCLLRHAEVKTLMHGYAKPESPESVWGRLFDEMRASPMEKMLVSSEEFMRIAEFPDAAEKLEEIISTQGKDFDYKIIVYLRPPADQVASWYNQMVKMRQPIGDFDAALGNQRIEAIHYDYARALDPWIRIFGRDKVIVRPYPQRGAPPETLVMDFYGLLGLDLTADEARPKGDPNPRFDDRLLEPIRLAQNAGADRVSIDAARDRMAEYVKRQDRFLGKGDGLALARERAQAGLARLSDMTGQSFDGFDKPIAARPVGPDLEALTLQIGFLQSEIAGLQKRIRTLEQAPKPKPSWRTRLTNLIGR